MASTDDAPSADDRIDCVSLALFGGFPEKTNFAGGDCPGPVRTGQASL